MKDNIDLYKLYKLSCRNLDTRDRVRKLAVRYLQEGNYKKYTMLMDLYKLLRASGEELLELF